MNFEFFIAKRYFKAKRKTGFISIITYVSIVGVAIGVAALIIVLSVMNGFESEVRTRLINSEAHLRLRKFHTEPITEYKDILDSLKKIDQIVGATPTIVKEGVIRSKDGNQPVIVKAVDTTTLKNVFPVDQYELSGKFSFEGVELNGRTYPGIILGRYLAENLYALNPGKIVTLVIIPEDASLMTPPRIKQFIVNGIVETGYYEYDKLLAMISLEEGQKFFQQKHSVSWIEIKIKDYLEASQIGKKIEDMLGYPFMTLTWFDMNRNLFSWITIEKWGTFVVLSLIIMVAAFNIISSLIMIVMEKTKEIGILKSMGTASGSIMRIFLFEGLLVGVIGAGIGTILGFLICFLQIKFGIISLPADVYIINKLPVEMHIADFIAIISAALILCLLASVYPAYKASKLNPVEAIRYE
ncbi:MAG: lipoprotein-releasing ABC transporter permease subunit [Calditrichia bacterium]